MNRTLTVVLLSLLSLASGETFEVVQEDDRLILTRGGAPVAHYVFRDEKILRPYFAHVHAPGGVPVTRTHPPNPERDPVDHAEMHPGIWLGFGDLSGHDFWRNRGRIRHERFTGLPVVKDGILTFNTESTLVTEEDSPIASLGTSITLVEKEKVWLLTWEATFAPLQEGFYFGDQEEMGLGIRVATAISEKNGGLLTNSGGITTAKDTWGQKAAWCDYSGVIAGRRVGLLLVPDPANAHPSWWHNRDYGVFVSNPFGRNAMQQGEPSRIEVKSGETYRLSHTLLIHASESPATPDFESLLKRLTP